MTVDLVIPTIGRPSLQSLFEALVPALARTVSRVIVVDDRAERSSPIAVDNQALRDRVEMLATNGRRGPAAARNVGWRASHADWIAFLDDDVVPMASWFERLGHDLDTADRDPAIGGVQGRIVVPLPADRRPTNWERDVAGLEAAAFVTADLAYRRTVLERVGGFDEHFTGAYREDADLALRVRSAGYEIARGTRAVLHPVGPASRWTTITRQRGNAADARMRVKHGRQWRARARAPRGRLPAHVATLASGAAALIAFGCGRPRRGRVAALVWAALTLHFVAVRVRPGPRDLDEITTMVLTSVAIPPAAVFHRAAGEVRERRRVKAVLFDRDGTLVVDVPYNGDPARVQPVQGAGIALSRLRAHGIQIGVVTNQSGIALGRLSHEQVGLVNRRIEEMLGPIAGWWYCPHGPADACACRKPAPALVRRALTVLRCRPRQCVMIGDTEGDVLAARRAGCRGILVPNERTDADEVRRAVEVAPDLAAAVDMVLVAL